MATETILDPETDKELVFTADTHEELENQIEAYFNPEHEG